MKKTYITTVSRAWADTNRLVERFAAIYVSVTVLANLAHGQSRYTIEYYDDEQDEEVFLAVCQDLGLEAVEDRYVEYDDADGVAEHEEGCARERYADRETI